MFFRCLLLVGLAGCAHVEDSALPTLKFEHKVLGKNGTACPAWNEIPMGKGRTSNLAVVKMRFTADRPVSYKVMTGALQDRGAQFCVDGIQVTKAVMIDGARGFVEIEGLGWRESTAKELKNQIENKLGEQDGDKEKGEEDFKF